MTLRDWQLCSNQCPPENPCQPEISKQYRSWWDSQTKQSEPGLLRKAVNFGQAVIKHIAAGLPGTAEHEYARRTEICQGCPHHIKDRDACTICGCNLQVKRRWAEQHCPQGYW